MWAISEGDSDLIQARSLGGDWVVCTRASVPWGLGCKQISGGWEEKDYGMGLGTSSEFGSPPWFPLRYSPWLSLSFFLCRMEWAAPWPPSIWELILPNKGLKNVTVLNADRGLSCLFACKHLVTMFNLDVLLSLFETSLLFHVQL